jgi:hypothetical protein
MSKGTVIPAPKSSSVITAVEPLAVFIVAVDVLLPQLVDAHVEATCTEGRPEIKETAIAYS